MRTLKVWLIGAGLVLSGLGLAGEPGKQVAASFQGTVERSVGYDYLLWLPEAYGESEKKWPLMLFLHGAGERGSDLDKVKVHGPPKRVAAGHSFPFILVSPQCPTNAIWDTNALLALIDSVEGAYRVDSDRIYVTGLSMGGFGTWSLVAAAPSRFAAAAPICGGGNFIEFVIGGSEHRAALGAIPLWVFHGAKDRVVQLSESERLVKLFRRGNQNVEFTIYPEAGHDSWTESYDNPKLYEWFLKQSR